MEWPVFKGENQTGTKHEKMFNITSYGSNENKNYIKIGSHPSQKYMHNKYWAERKGVLTHVGSRRVPATCSWPVNGLQTDSSSHSGNWHRDSLQIKNESNHGPLPVLLKDCTQVWTHNSRGTNKKSWPVHNEAFQPQTIAKSGSLWSMCVTGDDHVNKLSLKGKCCTFSLFCGS